MGWRIPQFIFSIWYGTLTQKQRRKYEAAVEQQIAEGRQISEARTRAAMDLIGENPHTQAAQQVLTHLQQTIPSQMRGEYKGLIDKAEVNRGEFLGTYDKRMASVTGLLDQYGEQAAKDIGRTFDEAQASSIGRLTEQGLTGGGVGSSIAHGFATRKADALARARQEAARVKAESLFNIESGRAAYDAAQRGDTQALRERALQNPFLTEIDLGRSVADFYGGLGQNTVDAYLGTTGDYFDFVTGVQNVPPDTTALNQFMYAAGGGRG